MYNLRALITSLCLALSTVSLGASQSLSFTFNTSSQNGRVEIGNPQELYRIGQTSETLQYRIEGLGKWNTQVGLQVAQPDYSNVLIRDNEGNENFLSQLRSEQNELSASASIEYLSGPHAVSLGWSGSVSDSPFSSQSIELLAERSFFAQTSTLGTKLTYANLGQPLNYYTNQQFQFSQRPTEVNAYRLALHHEQFLSENWKMRNEIALGRRIEDRPKHLSITSLQAYALTDRLFADLRASYISEFRSDALQDELGYFQTYGAKATLHFEPLYDFIVSISYGLFFEREDEPRSGSLTQVASDQYGVGAEYLGKNFDVRIQAAYAISNASNTDMQFSGGLTWRL